MSSRDLPTVFATDGKKVIASLSKSCEHRKNVRLEAQSVNTSALDDLRLSSRINDKSVGMRRIALLDRRAK